MCLSTVFIKFGEQQEKVMQDVAQMEYSNEGYLLIGLLGNEYFVKGKIKKIDFVDDHSVILERDDWHGEGIIANTFLGSTAKRVLRRTRKPVFIIPLSKGEMDITFHDI